jgi:hypothetical protein
MSDFSLFDRFGSDKKDKAYHFKRVGYVCKTLNPAAAKIIFFVPHGFFCNYWKPNDT